MKQVWFNLQAEYSPQAECSPQVNGTENKTSPAFSFHEFASHGESSDVTEGSDLSEYSQRSSLSVHKFSRLGESSQQGSSLSGQELSQYSLQSSMDANPSSETVSSHDSPDISQQESTLSDGQYGCDEGNSTSSLHDSPHDEAVSSAIMEVSGELMLGKFSSHRQGSGGSESSDISDEDMRRTPSGGAIAKYPESSTGLSDNDWNPYATESDTNQTPRSPRSAASDEQNRVGFVSKATFSITQPTDSMTTVTMTTGEVTVGEPKPERFVLSDRDSRFTDDIEMTGRKTSERLDILRYVIDDDDDEQANDRTTDIVGKESRSQEAYVIHESPDTARSGYTDGSRSGRQSTESCKSLDSLRRESTESGLTIRSQESTLESCRPSLEFDRQAEYESRESAELARHLPDKRVSTRSSLQSWESGPDGRSSRSDFDKSGESGFSGRQSADSQHSGESQKSTGRSIGSELSDRLERLSDAAGDNLKELIEFESAQRAVDAQIQDLGEATSKSLQLPKQDDSGDSVSRTRFTARIEHDASPVRSTQSPERCSNVTSNGYISIAERERLLYSESSDINQQVRKTNEEKVDTRYDRTADATYDSPDISQPVRRTNEVKVDTRYDRKTDADFERSRPSHSSTNLPKFSEALTDRSPSDISMKRVAKLFDDTKRQVREAVAIPRPEPSGSEERFPLHERLMWPAHDDSFKMQDRSGELEKRGKPQDSEAASSLTSEEVARVLGRYVNDDVSRSQRMGRSHEDTGTSVQNSAFDRIDSDGLGTSGALQIRHYAVPDTLNSLRAGEVSDDELSKHVKALLTETGHLGIVSENDGQRNEYVPRTMDYTRLQKDLQEIQDCLHDVPPPAANDSIHIQRRNHRDCLKAEAECTPRDELRSLEITGTTSGGRESGVSEYGRRLVWDHGADLEYDEGYGGQFIGTTTTTNTFSPRLIGTGDTDILIVRPDSAVTDETLNDAPEPDETKTWTGSGITRAEKIVEQIMSRRAEGDLKESVEDIIARYKNEQKDLFDRLQAPAHPQTSQPDRDAKSEDIKPVAKIYRPIFKDPNMELHVPSSQQNGISIEQPDGKKQPGLAERVYKILTSENGSVDNSDSPEEKGMAKKVYKILASDRPHEQANGILTEAMANEHEILKHLVTRPKDDSSVEDSGLNGTTESFDIEDKDVRKQLQWSQFSSPDKGEKSDFAALQEVTSAPYLALSNAKSLLSTQLKKMSERNFDKSIEIRTPYQQVECYPVYGVDRLGQQGPDSSAPREAWMPARRSAGSTSRDRDRALASDRFFLTEKDHVTKDLEAPQQRMRTYSDPFEVSPSKRSTSSIREGHARSRSEEAGNVSELSEYSFAEPEYSPAERRSTQSPRNLRPGTLATPQRHRPQGLQQDGSPSPTESDTSGSKKGARLRPYRPAGSRDLYYTESGDDTNDTNDSGTTAESTHPGSDDAAPPYIPSQYLGSRRIEPSKHAIGIYGNKEKDNLSSIDENFVKIQDEKVKAVSASRREGNSSDRRSTADTAYQTGAARSRSPASLRDSGNPLTQHSVTTEVMQTEYKTIEKELKYDKQTAVSACDGSGREGTSSSKHGVDTGYQSMRSSAPVTLQDDNDLYSKGQGTIGLERPGFKTREEFQRDFERREKELKEVLTRHSQKVEPQQDCLGTSTRSDPGMFEDSGNRWEYRISDQMNEFRRLEPEPAYPDDRLRCSRSKSDTDLVALSPTESQRYSSPMQPGARFLEFSTQQSPIFAHHDSMTYQTRGEPSGVLADRLRVPTIREQRQIPISKELPKVYDRRPVLSTQEHPMRPLEPVESHMRPIEPWEMLHDLRSADLEADPRKIGNLRKASKETSMNERSKSPLSIRQKEMEAELVKLNEELSEQVNDIHEEKPEENFEDNFPPSKKAQALRQVLEQEYMENLPPNINDMWTRFKERTEQSVTDSSLNSTRLDALSGLLQNPTHHDVNSFMEMTVKHRQEDAEKVKQLREERFTENEVERKKIAAEKATQQRNLRRQKMKNRQGLSEEESNGSYSEIISENEKNEQRRKKDGVREEQREKKHIKTKLPSKRSSEMACEERRKDRERNDRKAKVASKAPTEMSREERKKDRNRKTTEECSITDIRAKHSDTMDTLFSIPEDASFEQSPSKVESEMKSKQRRYRHVIDPLMKKLRDKIKLQRDKIDKERRKELQRVQKLKKLEMLLNAKRKGKLSDKAIDVELGDVSSTTTISHTESSKSSFTCLSSTGESDLSSQGSKTLSSHGSTTLKDSTVDSAIILQVKKYSPEEFRGCKTVQSDSTESSDFSNIIVERIPKMKSKRKGKDKKIGNNNEVNEFGRKRRRENKEKRQKAVFGVELTDKDIVNQIQRYDNFMSPERRRLMRVQNYSSPQRQGHVRDAGIMYPSENYLSPQLHRHMRDASTMYPSPITVSPPSRRRMREVLMKSEAIQTSPSIRTSSPTHAYDEVPITPVPYMSRGNCKMSKRRPSPSPTRSSQTSFSASPPRKTSKSPTTRKSSMSPSARKVSSSPPRRRFSPPITRRQAQSPIWKPESEIIPPQNSMFTPEGDENTAPNTCAEKDVQTWFIPMKPSQPWRQPLKERQAFSVRQEAWEPKSVSQSTWKGILHGDVLKDKGDPSDISRDTKFDLDPEGQPIGEDETLTDSDDELGVSKFRPLSKMTLQQAFQVRKGIAISRLRERQKRLNLATVQRKMEAFLQTERERLFQEERRTEANPDAHPYSEHLHKPGRRVISKEEMKEMTKKRYKKLPEILEQQSMKKRQDEYSLNRIKARLFNRRIQKKVLVKADKWGR